MIESLATKKTQNKLARLGKRTAARRAAAQAEIARTMGVPCLSLQGEDRLTAKAREGAGEKQ